MPPIYNSNPFARLGMGLATTNAVQPGGTVKLPFGMSATAAPSEEQRRKMALEESARAAGNFAGQGEAGYGQMSAELAKQRQFFNDMMNGRNSVATEQLRQGLQQQQAQQMSMAAGASPQNSAMAARTAAMMMGRNASGMAGQAAQAQLAERQMAADQLAKMNLGQRGQDIEVGLGSRQNQMTGLGANRPDKPKEPTFMQNVGAGIGAAAGKGLFSDERLKTDIGSGDKAAKKALQTLAAKTYRYKDEKYGAGGQLGVMAQALERAGLGQAVIDTDDGKMIDTNKLTGANTALLASIGRRVDKLEKGRR